ncbi:MAG TPA: response regulator transcription factor [Bordetella sp.]
MSRVALIEDHERLAQMIRQGLSASGIEADLFGRISEAAYAVAHADYAVLIMDRGLPDGDGLAFLRTLRAQGHAVPCLMLTARDALHDRVDGLESGADDYLTKPFAMSELVARVRTLMRRPAALAARMPALGDIAVDPAQQTVQCGSQSSRLAPAELQILLALIRAEGRTVRHAALEHAAWGFSDSVTPNALDVTLHRLRKKLVALGATTRLVNTRGTGFALREMDAPDA